MLTERDSIKTHISLLATEVKVCIDFVINAQVCANNTQYSYGVIKKKL